MLLLLLLSIGALYITPLSMNVYSPLPAMMSPWSDRVQVYGNVVYENMTPAVGVEVRIFGTDDLQTEIVHTDSDGYFISSFRYDTGQVITIAIDGLRTKIDNQEPFIDYNAREDEGPFYLGTFVIE